MKKPKLIFITLLLLYTNANAKEFKLGLMQHDFNNKLGNRVEKGQNINIELLFDKMDNWLKAYPHIGASVNNRGYTSNVYTGLTWQFLLKDLFLIEASLGASINNAEKKTTKKRRALGSNVMFRESFSIGIRLNEKYSASVMIDHISNADLAKPNPGLTDLGIRLGYVF